MAPACHWETALIGAAGVWMVGAAFVLDFHDAGLAMAHAGVSGAMLVLLGMGATLRFRRWMCFAALAAGMWIFEAPWVFDFATLRVAALNTIGVGGVVFLLALWALLDADRLADEAGAAEGRGRPAVEPAASSPTRAPGPVAVAADR
jgi:hypothetical protein